MTAPERILTYIQKTYQPEAVVVYGSFADGSAGAGSDFDALVIAGSRACHDASEIDGVTLDVFVYPAATFCADYDPEDFVQIFDGKILLDAAQLRSCKSGFGTISQSVRKSPMRSSGRRWTGVGRCSRERSATTPRAPTAGIGS